MAQARLSDAPGCLGSIAIWNRRHPLCNECVWRKLCHRMAAKNLDDLNQALGVERAERAVVLRAANVTKPPTLTVKGATTLEALEKRNITAAMIRKAMRMSDPLTYTADWKPAFMRWGFIYLARMGGSVTRTQLSNEFQRQFAWRPPSAASHVSAFADVAGHLGIASIDDERIIAL